MKSFLSKLGCTALFAASSIITNPVIAAQNDAYNPNDVLLFLQNPAGTVGTDKVVYFSLGSAVDVFRDSPEGTVTPLGNINTILTSTFGADWTNKTATIFAGAAGQNGATHAAATTISDGDYARTVYVTKPRSAAGTSGKPNSSSPLFDPAQTAVAGNISGANNISGMSQPGAVEFGSTTLESYNPFSNGNPSTAFGALAGGIQGAIGNATTLGDVENTVVMLDLYRVTKTTGTNAADATLWHIANVITATDSKADYPGSNGARADFLGTITLGTDGSVNFISKGVAGPLYLSSVSLPYGGEILSYADGKLLSTNSGNGTHAIQFYSLGQNGSLTDTGSANLSSILDGVESIAAQYTANDIVLFFQNPDGSVGNDQVLAFSLGNAVSVFRDASSSYTVLGNLNSALTTAFGADWTNKAATIFAGAAGQNGATHAASTTITNGDYARTVYVTKPRTAAGTEGQANSSSPLYDPSQTAVAGNISGANNISGFTVNPLQVGFASTTIDSYNPLSNGNPSTAYGAIQGGIQGALSAIAPFDTNAVAALDLYRVTKTSGTNADDASLWHLSSNLTATHVATFAGGSTRADYLGTIVVQENGEVGFFSAFAGITDPIYSISSVSTDSRGFAVASVIPQNPATKGRVVFFNTSNGTILNNLEVGYHPDCVTITPDGTKVLVANEGELRIDGSNLIDSSLENPGSMSVIAIGNGTGISSLTQNAVNTFTFESANLASGVTIAGLRNARLDTLTVKTPDYRDIEPEYITATDAAAYITLQENNAIAVFDFATSKFSAIYELGTIEQLIDASDRDGVSNSKSISINDMVNGLPMPDTITKFTRNGTLYLATANEGDARPDDGDTARGSTLTPNMTAGVAAIVNNTGIGRLKLLKFEGDTNSDGVIDTPIMLGTRSFTIWNAITGNLVWDSAEMIEEFVAENDSRTFNMESGLMTNYDTRSDDKGPEPEAIAYASFGGKDYIFVGAERQNGIFQFDITDLTDVKLVGYRNTVPNIYSETAALVSPESIVYIPANQNPTSAPLILVGYEGATAGTGSIGVFQVGDEVPVPTITSNTTASGTVGTAFSYTITGSNSPTSYGATGLPAGLTINTATGVISGTPTSAGISAVAISATNAGGTGNGTLTISVVDPAPTLTSNTSANGRLGTAFSYTITGSNSPTSYGATGLPAGLTINTVTGVISGTPTTTGTTTVAIRATNSGGTGNANLTISVKPRLPVLTSGASAAGKVGSAFKYTILATDASSYAVVGTLPSGLAYNSTTKSITGTPTKPGTYKITLRATNTIGEISTKVLTISIQSAAPVITSKTAVSGKVKKSFSYKVTATNSPTSYSASNLPAGLKIDSKTGQINGTPSKTGSFNSVVKAVNKYGAGSANIKITISK